MTMPVNPLAGAQRPALAAGRAAEAAGAGAAPSDRTPSATAAVDTPSDAVQQATPTQLRHAVHEVNAALQGYAVGLRFEVDADTDKLIVKVVDRDSGEVIRQIPSQETLRIAKMLDRAAGLLLQQRA